MRVARCEHCQRSFEVDDKFTGGLVPCPGCGKVVEAGGLRDPMWLLLRIGAVALAVGVGVLVSLGQPPWFVVTAVAAVLLVLWSLSRAF